MTESELAQQIARSVAELDEVHGRWWRRIHRPLHKWQRSPEGDAGGGFWVAGTWDGRVLWYNDIEEGFNWSPYSTWGVIGTYGANQATLRQALSTLVLSPGARRQRLEAEFQVEPGSFQARCMDGAWDSDAFDRAGSLMVDACIDCTGLDRLDRWLVGGFHWMSSQFDRYTAPLVQREVDKELLSAAAEHLTLLLDWLVTDASPFDEVTDLDDERRRFLDRAPDRAGRRAAG